jgi:hypothetical protein
MLLATPLAFGGAGTIKTTVLPISTNVTYSRAQNGPTPALDTFVGYTVVIENLGGNTINNIRFTATTTVTDSAEKATFSSADGATCWPASSDKTSIECTIGQLTAGKAFPKFAVFFKAPTKVVNGDFDGDGEDSVNISGITYYAEGTGGPNSVPDNSVGEWPASTDVINPVELGTCNPDNIKSALPKSGGTFFTGGSDACASDPFSVAVSVPPYTTYSTVTLDETDITTTNINCTSLGNFFKCYDADVAIPNVVFDGTSYLSVVLRVLASNIKPGTKITKVLIQYTDDVGGVSNIGDCASPTTPRNDFIPCIAERKYYKNKSVSGWTPELDGAFEFRLLNLKNGRYAFF